MAVSGAGHAARAAVPLVVLGLLLFPALSATASPRPLVVTVPPSPGPTAGGEHDGDPSLTATGGHRRVLLHVLDVADPAQCGPVSVRRDGELVDRREPRQAPDGTWGVRVKDLDVPAGQWRYSAAQVDRGCAVTAEARPVWSSDVWTHPERPQPGQSLVVHGAGFDPVCPPLDVALGHDVLGRAAPDAAGTFALSGRAPTRRGPHELLVTRRASELCDSPLRLHETVHAGPPPSGRPTTRPGVPARPDAGGPGTANPASRDVVRPTPDPGGTARTEPVSRQRELHPVLALLALLPVAAVPAYRRRQRRLVRRVSLVPRRPSALQPRLRPPSGPTVRSVRLAPRAAAPTVRYREAPP